MTGPIKEQPVSTDEAGQPVLGYVIKQNQLSDFLQIIDKKMQGTPYLLLTQEVGDDEVRVIISGISFQAAEAVTGAIAEALNDSAQFQKVEQATIDPTSVSFDVNPKRRR